MGTLKANVYMHDELAGVLEKKDGYFTFEYADSYHGNAISLSLPRAKKRFKSNRLFPFFRSLLPEGWLLNAYSRAQKIDERDELSLLVNNGEDLLGAVSVRLA